MAKQKPTPEHTTEHNPEHTSTEANSPAHSGRQSITVQGIVFEAPAPYAAGHVLNAVEAGVLNQTYGENLRNNFAGVIRKKLEDHNKALKASAEAEGRPHEDAKALPADHIEGLRSEFAEYASKYVFAARGTRTPTDPIRAEAEKIAGEMVKAALRARNIKQKDLAEGQFDKLVDQLVDSRAEIMEEAKKRVEATKSLADSLQLGL